LGRWVDLTARRWTVAAAIAFLAVTLAGCGGSTSSSKTASQPAATTTAATTTPVKKVVLGKLAYDRRMKQLGAQLAGSVQHLFPLVEAQPGTKVSKLALAKLRRTRAVVTSVQASIAAIAPPAEIRTEHQKLLQGVSALGGELDALISVEENGTSKPFGDFAHFDSLRSIARARNAIEKKGYPIG
jgi:hypothetical protein